ncbi:hypothetical protein MEW_00153 [Candida albicans P60002]|uniref:Large ribosomal subunit protein uL23m n=2 Tax=Candida albicans TaxID=5476 RepID=A0A1D8PCJ1_CANAL|nr:mitochondrial 54S ribosomal protein YmL41 [Candida albicans SC5314]KAF6070266.1 Ribosomal protein L23 family protein [Candida albicans]KGQ98560.1 hypothetical protein MEU_00149 [Candida albicans P37005]KGQ99287.1 hypothetical protein MEO_00146 [Candida albicans P94015]KGR04167.1 hypothetical protein MG1_00145 [Candida albicans GC75]KGU33547.1 hypothetical protein MG7_00146 [Candida albicans P34048]KGU36351.1 hypothetical protein MGM_00147 [Candida albicans P75063]KGU37379.1 hypothetical p|eukprot:XP_718173.2 mitochondrial 54S ribosomal protein YmL41 [Candida albicans SC5314]
MDGNTRSGRLVASIWKSFTRSIHYKPLAPNKYPKVNVNDVDLNPPRYGFRRIRPPIIAQSPTKTLFPSVEIAKKYIEEGKRVPNRFMDQFGPDHARKEFEEFQEKLALEEPHFKIGGKQIYFPQGRICLLRSNAKHTPYQAKFLVPKSMNKMDLRDYLWHIYGLRALNITVQLQPARWKRSPYGLGRYRSPQLKKMTVDMMEPFIWPEVPQAKLDLLKTQRDNSLKTVQQNTAVGADKLKPLEVYDGMYKEQVQPQRFVSEKFKREAEKNIKLYNKVVQSRSDRKSLENYLGL